MTRTRIVGISFDHMHMGDLLHQVHEQPGVELVGIFDPDPQRMTRAAKTSARLLSTRSTMTVETSALAAMSEMVARRIRSFSNCSI